MIETYPKDPVITIDLSIADLVAWGYETSGDFDEALRVYTEKSEADGYKLEYTLHDLEKARADFKLEFGDRFK